MKMKIFCDKKDQTALMFKPLRLENKYKTFGTRFFFSDLRFIVVKA